MRFARSWKYRIACLFTISGLISCAAPTTRYANKAMDYGFERFSISSKPFDHIVFKNAASVAWEKKSILHIYIEGDGTPWVGGKWIAQDPTPRKPVMLGLMQLDDTPAVLLGRPCYHVNNTGTNCRSENWTSARYSSEVVKSMVGAVRTLQARFSFERVMLFGHSGGGVLATLMASELQRVAAVVTLGANLDIDAWVASHGFAPLDQSVNPAHLPAVPSATFQLHLYGRNDRVVNYDLLADYFANRPDVTSTVYDGFDHTCCWANVWPEILQSMQNRIQNSPRYPAVTE